MSHVTLAPGARVGLTTTIPVEILLAAGLVPVDLNNIFIASPQAYHLVMEAEARGLPRTICAWVKGLYTTLKGRPEIAAVVLATQGDCSYTQALGELWEAEGITVIHFKYPYPRDPEQLARELMRFRERLGVSPDAAEEARRRLIPLRRDLARLDRLTWDTGQVRGRENFRYLIAASDFEGDPGKFAREVADFLQEAEARPPRRPRLRLGLAGIPPIFTDLWDYLEELDAEVVFNEIPRQFAMPYEAADLVSQYTRYTYPYDIAGRLLDLAKAAARRHLDGVIHYTQSFCFRQMYDQLLRERLGLPVLTLEGDRPGPLDARTRLRLEAFVDVLRP